MIIGNICYFFRYENDIRDTSESVHLWDYADILKEWSLMISATYILMLQQISLCLSVSLSLSPHTHAHTQTHGGGCNNCLIDPSE